MLPNCFHRLLKRFRQWKKSPRSTTEFDYLPPHIFLKILRYLPIQERIRIGRVNRLFYEMSIMWIKNTKELDLSDNDDADFMRWSKNFNRYPKSLANILQLCSSSLEKMVLVSILNRHFLYLLHRFKYPRLTSVGVHFTSSFIHDDPFGQFMTSNRYLEYVEWFDEYTFPVFNFAGHFVCENLISIILLMANGETVRSLTRRCPRLKKFMIKKIYPHVSPECLDDFFDGCPNLEYFRIENDTATTQFRWSTQLVHFWNLESIRILRIGREAAGNNPFNESDLRMIATSFLRLELLTLQLLRVNTNSNGIAALTSLKNLKCIVLELCGVDDFDENVDLAVRKFVKCGQLQALVINVSITTTTFILLVQRSSQLRELAVSRVTEVYKIDEAITIVRCFDGYVERDLSIRFFRYSYIWLSDEVATILREIRTNEFAIKFDA